MRRLVHTPVPVMHIGGYIHVHSHSANGRSSGGEEEARCFVSVRMTTLSRCACVGTPVPDRHREQLGANAGERCDLHSTFTQHFFQRSFETVGYTNDIRCFVGWNRLCISGPNRSEGEMINSRLAGPVLSEIEHFWGVMMSLVLCGHTTIVGRF